MKSLARAFSRHPQRKSCKSKRPPKRRSTPLPSTRCERSRSPSASSSTHETFNLQRVNPTAHTFRNIEIEKLERTARQLRDHLEGEELTHIHQRTNKDVTEVFEREWILRATALAVAR